MQLETLLETTSVASHHGAASVARYPGYKAYRGSSDVRYAIVCI